MSLHSGGTGGGHYTALSRNFVDGRWRSCDDTHVSEADEKRDVPNNKSAYVLFYRRQGGRLSPAGAASGAASGAGAGVAAGGALTSLKSPSEVVDLMQSPEAASESLEVGEAGDDEDDDNDEDDDEDEDYKPK